MGNKTGVINDPLGQPTVPAGNDCSLIPMFWDGRTDNLWGNSDHRGRPRGSIGVGKMLNAYTISIHENFENALAEI